VPDLSIPSTNIKFISGGNLLPSLSPMVSINDPLLAFLIQAITKIHSDEFFSGIAQDFCQSFVAVFNTIVVSDHPHPIVSALDDRPISLFRSLDLIEEQGIFDRNGEPNRNLLKKTDMIL
jgi:hypothetical protein